MLMTRIATALFLLLVLMAILAWGEPWAWSAFVALALFAAFWEWGRLGAYSPSCALQFASLGAVVFIWMLQAHDLVLFAYPLMALAAIFWVVMAPLCLARLSVGLLKKTPIYFFTGGVLICAAGLALVLAYQVSAVFLISVLSICWVADVFAYVFGRLWGQNKLAPGISPGKSWEGALGGTLAVVAFSWLLIYWVPSFPSLQSSWQYMAYTKWNPFVFSFWLIVLSVFSVVGDLFESLLKRRCGLKDSSQLLPGHGGVLDRIDAQLPVLPLALLLLGSAGI